MYVLFIYKSQVHAGAWRNDSRNTWCLCIGFTEYHNGERYHLKRPPRAHRDQSRVATRWSEKIEIRDIIAYRWA